MRKRVTPMGGNSTWNVNKIDFISFVTCYMMTKMKLYDKEQNSIFISKRFICLRIMKNQYVNWVHRVNFNYTLYIGLFVTGMAVVSISSEFLLGFSNMLTLPFNRRSFLVYYLKINFNSRFQKILKHIVRKTELFTRFFSSYNA
jgi:hypothetical protein